MNTSQNHGFRQTKLQMILDKLLITVAFACCHKLTFIVLMRKYIHSSLLIGLSSEPKL